MSYLVDVDQQERTGLSLPPQQQAQSMQLNVNFDTTGYPIATIAQQQPIISETSKKNSLLVVGVLAGALACSGAIGGYYLGASGESRKAQQQQVELTNTRSDIENLCKKYPK